MSPILNVLILFIYLFTAIYIAHFQCKQKRSDHGPGPANNVLGRRQIVICSAQGPTSISHVYADFSGLGLRNITWAGEELFLTSPGDW